MITQFKMGLKPSLLENYYQKPIPIKNTDFKISFLSITNFEQGIATQIFRTENKKEIQSFLIMFTKLHL